MTDKEIKKMLKYLAWSVRCSFTGDVIDKATAYMMNNFSDHYTKSYINFMSRLLSDKLTIHGPAGTYQYFISDDDMLTVLSHVLNQGDM